MLKHLLSLDRHCQSTVAILSLLTLQGLQILYVITTLLLHFEHDCSDSIKLFHFCFFSALVTSHHLRFAFVVS